MPEHTVVLHGEAVYTTFIEPMLTHACSVDTVEWTTWRDRLPPPDEATEHEADGMHIDDEVVVHRGSLSVEGGLELCNSGILVVLGDLAVRGGVVSLPLDDSAVVVRGRLTVDRMYVGGDVIALGGIEADVVWGVGNDHVTCTPTLVAKTYVAQDRGDVVGTCVAEVRLDEDDVDVRLRQHFENLDPSDPESVCNVLELSPRQV